MRITITYTEGLNGCRFWITKQRPEKKDTYLNFHKETVNSPLEEPKNL